MKDGSMERTHALESELVELVILLYITIDILASVLQIDRSIQIA